MGLLLIIFRTIVPELWPLIYAEILFLFNILRTTLHIFTKFHIYAFIMTRSSLGLLHVVFRKFVPELWPFIYAKSYVSAQYLEKKWTDFDQTLYNYLY